MRKLVHCLVILLFVGTVFAQGNLDLKGVIVGSQGKPLKNVELSVLYTRISTKSNKKGEFTLKKLNATDSIRVTVGKDKVADFLVGNNKQASMEIQDDIVSITFDNGDNIATRLRQLTDDERNQAGIITAKIIQRNAFRSLEQAMRDMIPGLNFFTTTDGEIGLTMRGSSSLKSPSNALVIIDGAETNFNDANNSLSIYDVDRIEVHKDGMGYGVKGAGGVVIIKTKGRL